jgi:peroxiredoxin
VYVKKDCGLCGPLWETVQKVKKDIDFEAEKIDIATDPELQRKYALEVPVVLIDGRKAFKGSMTEQAFKKKLKRGKEGGKPSQAKEGAGKEGSSRARRAGDDEVDASEPVAPVPPSPVIALFLGAAIAGAGFFFFQGVSSAELGRGRLASTLFRVESSKRDRAIDFSLPTFDGKKLSLSDYRGKVLFINFWATWCPPCIEEMPSMKRFQERMKADPRFAFLAISADGSWEPVRKFFEKEPPPFTVVLDENGKLAKEYGTEKFPETYVVMDGRIVGYIVGPRDWDTWYAEAYARAVLDHGTELKQPEIALR